MDHSGLKNKRSYGDDSDNVETPDPKKRDIEQLPPKTDIIRIEVSKVNSTILRSSRSMNALGI